METLLIRCMLSHSRWSYTYDYIFSDTLCRSPITGSAPQFYTVEIPIVVFLLNWVHYTLLSDATSGIKCNENITKMLPFWSIDLRHTRCLLKIAWTVQMTRRDVFKLSTDRLCTDKPNNYSQSTRASAIQFDTVYVKKLPTKWPALTTRSHDRFNHYRGIFSLG